jgi:hypothetical protein
LRDTIATTRLRLIDAEDGVLVTVECDGLAMTVEISASGFKVTEGRLRVAEVKLHEPTGGVIHVDKQRATSSTLFEPLMVTAIDLNEFTHAGPAIARLLNTVATASMRHPKAVFGHPLAERLLGNLQAVAFHKLLSGQGRPKVSVAGSDEPKDAVPKRRSHLMVAGSAPPS